MWIAASVGLGLVLSVSAAMWCWVNTTEWSAEQKAGAHLDVMKIATSLVVMLGGLGVLYLTMRRQRTQERQLAHAIDVAATTEEDALARRVTELYAKGVEQLGSDKAPVRLGGLYALERLADDNATQRQTVVNVLCAYLRMPYTPPDRTELDRLEAAHPEDDSKRMTELRERHEQQQQEQEVRVAARRILAAHLRPKISEETNLPTNSGYWPEQLRIDLTGAILVDADFGDCHFDEAVFDRTQFRGATKFHDAHFHSTARFSRAKFRNHVDFSGARFLNQAMFTHAEFLAEVDFNRKAMLRAANFDYTTFQRPVRFQTADFELKASFDSTVFGGGVTFHTAKFDSGADFKSSWFGKGGAGFREVTFAATTTFTHALFKGRVTFVGVVDPDNVDLDDAVATVKPWKGERIPGHAWPPGWELDPETITDTVNGLSSVLVRVNSIPDTPPAEDAGAPQQ